MAQANRQGDRGKNDLLLRYAKNTAVSVPASGNTILIQFPVAGMDRIFVQVTPTTNGFDAFLVQARSHPDTTAVTLYSTAADFTSPAGLMIGASGDLTALSAATTGWFLMDVRGLHDVTVQASASGGTATVDTYAGGQ